MGILTLLALLQATLLATASPIIAPINRRNAYSTPRLVAYVQTFHYTNGEPLSLLPLVNESTGVTHINLAALHINQDPSGITLNDVNPNDTSWDTLWGEVKQVQSAGVKVMMMMGGAAQGSYRRLCGTATPAVIDESYYGPLRDTIRYHGLDGMDLDIEESVDVSCPVALLQRLDADFGSDFILTMAPVASAMTPNGPGLSGFSYFEMDSQATSSTRPNGKLVNWYNAQFYNGWGDASTQVYYDNIILTGKWSPDRIVLGVLDNPNDGGSGFVGIKTLQSVIQQLRANFANFGCAVGWEYWDAGGADGYSDPWQWVKAVGQSIHGPENVPANLTYLPLPDPPAPFPGLTNTLVTLGATYQEAVWALNVTDGVLAAAEQLLGLGNTTGLLGLS